MAKSICIYSPWQFLFWYDRPPGSPGKKGGAGGAEGSIPELEELEFYSRLPTVWDNSLVLDGSMELPLGRKDLENCCGYFEFMNEPNVCISSPTTLA